jgi:RND family efflux transporter MFP subunit
MLSYKHLLLAVLLTGCSQAPQKPPAPPPPEVQVVEVKTRDVEVEGEWVGSLDGMVNAKIKPQVSGYLLRQHYQEGARVMQGQLLFEIDPRPFEAAAAQARAQVSQARGQVAQAMSQRSQAQALQSQANSQLLQATALLEQAQGQLAQAQASRAQAAANQRKTQMDEQRYRPLAEQKAVTQQDLDTAVQANLAALAQVQAADAQIQTARGTVSSARAQIQTARSAMVSAQAQIQTADAAITTAQAQVEGAEAQLQAAELNLSFTHITSPITGIAGIANAQVGDLVSPNTDALAIVSTVDPIKVNFNIPEQEYMDSLRRNTMFGSGLGSKHRVRFELVQADGRVYPKLGRFHAEDRNVATNTGAIRITALFDNPQAALRPGQYARVRATRYMEKGVIVLPQRAISELQDRHQVAVVGAGNKIQVRPVVVGERIGSEWIVKSGLKPGELVVAEGLQKAPPDSVVVPKPYAPAAVADKK